ncbi:MAG: radical SAM protein [Candidatus Thermoplasmatota archaeon]|nr:radical SAM protein [Candidatus Thermoplasmatota archaeon]
MYDPIERSERIEDDVCAGASRKYYRFRPARWYGGIVTGDVVGCNLLCLFCWAGDGIWGRTDVGKFYDAEQVYGKMEGISNETGHKLWRLSGQEPTIGREHLLGLLGLVSQSPYNFILETNGILLDRPYAEDLAGFGRLHVRVSLKGSNEEEFARLTGAGRGFDLQLGALSNLRDAGVSCHPAVMSSFSDVEELSRLKDRLASISRALSRDLEVEELIVYPHVKRRLRASTVQSRIDE